jgi:predicted nucleic acid-binding Zn ribbon protein
MASAGTVFCINCGKEISPDVEFCPNCDASQDPDEIEAKGDSAGFTEAVDTGPSAPFSVPKEVYYNKNWKRVKFAVALPFILITLPITAAVISSPIPDDPSFADIWLMLIATAVFFVGGWVGYISFSIYASRDMRVLSEECGKSTKRSPLMIILLIIFTVGFYEFYYLFTRNRQYKID